MTEDEQETADQDAVTEGDETEARLSKCSVEAYILKVLAICVFFVIICLVTGVVFFMFGDLELEPVFSVRQFLVAMVDLLATGAATLFLAMLVGLIAWAIRRPAGIPLAVGVGMVKGYAGGVYCVGNVICALLIGGLVYLFWRGFGAFWKAGKPPANKPKAEKVSES